MSRQVVYEVTHPYHPDGKTLVHAPGDQFPLGADLPDGLVVREVVAEVPDRPEPAKPAAKASEGRAAAKGAGG